MQCSRLLERMLCGDAKLWRSIRLDDKVRLSDEALRKLLFKVNARSTCTHLSLVGCSMVSGTGLFPLKGSSVLQVLDFRTRSASLTLQNKDLGIAALGRLIRSMCPTSEAEDAGKRFRMLLLDQTERLSRAEQKILQRVDSAVQSRLARNGTKCRLCKAAQVKWPASRALCAGCGVARPCGACEKARCQAEEIEQRNAISCTSCSQYWCGLCAIAHVESLRSCDSCEYDCDQALCSICCKRFMKECDCGACFCDNTTGEPGEDPACSFEIGECDICGVVICTVCMEDHGLCEECAYLTDSSYSDLGDEGAIGHGDGGDADSPSLYTFDDLDSDGCMASTIHT
jgi:hypothetical protein